MQQEVLDSIFGREDDDEEEEEDDEESQDSVAEVVEQIPDTLETEET